MAKEKCFDAMVHKDGQPTPERLYIEAKRDEYVKGGLSENDAILKAARDLQTQSVNNLNDVFAGMGVKGFEKITPKAEEPSPQPQQADVVGNEVQDRFGILEKLNRREINTVDGLKDGIKVEEVRTALDLQNKPSIERNELYEKIRSISTKTKFVKPNGDIGGEIDVVSWNGLNELLKRESPPNETPNPKAAEVVGDEGGNKSILGGDVVGKWINKTEGEYMADRVTEILYNDPSFVNYGKLGKSKMEMESKKRFQKDAESKAKKEYQNLRWEALKNGTLPNKYKQPYELTSGEYLAKDKQELDEAGYSQNYDEESSIENHRSNVEGAVKSNLYQKYISDGIMTAQDVKTIIESAGLEVPKEIIEKTTADENITPTPLPLQAEATGANDATANQTAKAAEEPNAKTTQTTQAEDIAKPPKPPDEKSVSKPDEPEPPQRRFTKQMLASDELSETSKAEIAKTLNYTRQTNKVTLQEANEIIDVVGLDEAQNLVMNDGDIKPAVRVTVAQILIKKYNELAEKATNQEDKNFYLDKTIQTANFVTEKLATESGQSIQAFAMWSRLSPEGQLRAANQDMARQGKEKLRKRQKDINTIGNKFKKANEETAEEITKSKQVKDNIKKADSKRVSKAKDKIIAARNRRENIIKKYKGGKGKNLFSSPTGLTPEGIEFVGNLVKTYIDEGVAKFEIIVDKVLSHLKDVVGKNPNDEVIKNVNDIVGERVQAMENKRIIASLSDLEKEVNRIVKEHYTVPEASKKSLIEKFISDAGLEKQDAQDLARDIQTEFDKIANRKKRNILYNEKARFDRINNALAGTKKPEPKTVQADLIKYSNLGAFDSNEFAELVASKFGLGEISPEQAAKLMELANRVQKAPEGSPKNSATEDLLAYRAKLRGNDLGETVQAVWYANVLSGYKTHEKNLISTFFNSMGELGAEMGKDPKSIPYILAGYAQGIFRRGLVEAAHTITTGRSPIHIKKIETPNVLERKTFVGGGFNPANWFKYVMRLMIAEDVLSFQGLKEARAYQLARKEASKQGFNTWSRSGWKKVNEILLHTKQRIEDARAQADKEGLKGLEKSRRVYELMEDSRPIQMTQDAYGFAAHGTFNHESEGSLGALTNAIAGALDAVSVGGVKPLRFIVPFTRIITNVVNNSLDFTPVGLVRAARGVRGFRTFEGNQFTKGAFKELTTDERKRLIAKATIGIAIAGAFQALHEAGVLELTGGGPDDPKKKQQLLQEGWQEYSIKIGGKYYSYKYTPLVFVAGFLGNMNDAATYNEKEKDVTFFRRMALATSRIVGQVADMTWINSGATFLGALTERSPDQQIKGVTNALVNMGKGFIPFGGAVTQTSQAIQDIFNMPQKQVNNAWGAAIQDFPIARNILNDKINALGDPITRDTDVFRSKETNDPVWKFLLDRHGWIAPVNKNTIIVFDPDLGIDRPITGDEYYEFSKLRGQKIKAEVEKLIDNGATVQGKDGKEEKTAFELTTAQLNVLLSNIEGEATKETKAELFAPKERHRPKISINN